MGKPLKNNDKVRISRLTHDVKLIGHADFWLGTNLEK